MKEDSKIDRCPARSAAPATEALKQVRSRKISDKALESLVQTAIHLGASEAAVLPSQEIRVEDHLAQICNGDPGCEQYGLAPSCPPHVPGPAGFRRWQVDSVYAIVVRIDVPAAAMFSDERRDIMQLLSEIVAGVERKASQMGFRGSKAFAGGSCKNTFCHDHKDCRVLSRQEDCRHPHQARASMSGFGISVAHLMQSLGWSTKITSRQQASDAQAMTWVAGLVLLAVTDNGMKD
jgi:predicted metal-binding protein